MRYVLSLAAIPAVIWAATPSASPPVVAKVVQSEGVREQRQDDSTFALRWRPVADMPATTIREVHYLVVGGEEAEAAKVVGTVPGKVDAPPIPRHRLHSRAVAGSPVRPPLERTNICARHGQRKVMVGKYRWRCRR